MTVTVLSSENQYIMSSATATSPVDWNIDELTARIGELGDMVKNAKEEKQPKEEWEPRLREMLALKVRTTLSTA